MAVLQGNCPECGLGIDAELLRQSGIPWANRKCHGWIRAYVATVRVMTFGSRTLVNEAGRPQEEADARVFRRVTVVLLSSALIRAFEVAIHRAGGLGALALLENRAVQYPAVGPLSPTVEWAIPWFAGATFGPVLPVCLLFWALFMTGAQRTIFRIPDSAEAPARERALSLASYSAAPLAFCLPAVVLMWIGAGLRPIVRLPFEHPVWYFVNGVTALGWGLVALALLGTFSRSLQWKMRVTHCGVGGGVHQRSGAAWTLDFLERC